MPNERAPARAAKNTNWEKSTPQTYELDVPDIDGQIDDYWQGC
jgi:hypothetical protein